MRLRLNQGPVLLPKTLILKAKESNAAKRQYLASPTLQEVHSDLQALRSIAQVSAVTIADELGQVSRDSKTIITTDELAEGVPRPCRYYSN